MKRVLITGATSGVGKDLARRLALEDDFDRIQVGCRDIAKGEAAVRDLQMATGRHVFEPVVVDLADLSSVNTAIRTLEGPLHTVVLNAGGTGGGTPMKLTVDGVTEIFASNVLGHVALLERLLAEGTLTHAAVMTGSEAARGVRQLRIPRPIFAAHSVNEFASVIDGSIFGERPNAMAAYGQVKYLGALWLAATARKFPTLRFVTMSPGNTSGTNVLRNLPAPIRTLAQRFVFPVVLPAFGLAHPLATGSQRLAAAVSDESLCGGVFYASAADKLTGPVVDQATIVPDFRDPEIQDRADEAVHRFLPADFGEPSTNA